MKREILCIECTEKLKYTVFDKPSFPREHIKFVKGILIRHGLVCDYCGKGLLYHSEVYCMSIWADYGGIPYYPWESDYIVVKLDQRDEKENNK